MSRSLTKARVLDLVLSLPLSKVCKAVTASKAIPRMECFAAVIFAIFCAVPFSENFDAPEAACFMAKEGWGFDACFSSSFFSFCQHSQKQSQKHATYSSCKTSGTAHAFLAISSRAASRAALGPPPLAICRACKEAKYVASKAA